MAVPKIIKETAYYAFIVKVNHKGDIKSYIHYSYDGHINSVNSKNDATNFMDTDGSMKEHMFVTCWVKLHQSSGSSGNFDPKLSPYKLVTMKEEIEIEDIIDEHGEVYNNQIKEILFNHTLKSLNIAQIRALDLTRKLMELKLMDEHK